MPPKMVVRNPTTTLHIRLHSHGEIRKLERITMSLGRQLHKQTQVVAHKHLAAISWSIRVLVSLVLVGVLPVPSRRSAGLGVANGAGFIVR